MKSKKWTAYDVPYLREDLIESLDFAAANMSLARNMLMNGGLEDQARSVQHHIMSVEVQHRNILRDDLPMHFASKSMCQMITEMHDSLPEWTVRQALPSDHGFMIFEKPVTMLDYVTDKDKSPVPLRGIFWHSYNDFIEIVTLTGRDDQLVIDSADGDNIFKIGLIYFHKDNTQGGGRKSTDVETNPNVFEFHDFDRDKQFDAIVSIVGATWLLMGQEAIVDDTPRPIKVRRQNKAESSDKSKTVKNVIVHERSLVKRSASAKYIKDKDSTSNTESHAQREYSKQSWWRRGHWRQQACGPEWSERKPVFIEPVLVVPDKTKDQDSRPEVTRWKK